MRLAGVKSSLHLEEFDNPSLYEEEEYLRNFDLGEEAKWSQYFAKNFAVVDATKTFHCYIQFF